MLHSLLLALTLGLQGAAPAPTQDPKHQADLDHDKEMGKRYSVQVDKEYKPSEKKELQERVERIGGEIAQIARREKVTVTWGDGRLNPFDYKFKVLKGKDVNAFSLPGGYIYIYEGLVDYVETDDELAGVLAHEISHAAFRHVATLEHEQNKFDVVQLPLILIAILSGGGQGAMGALQAGQLLSLATGSGWSLKAELAADRGGFEYIRRSRYNPTAMLTVMERMARDERNSPKIDWGIFRTHPPSRERAEALVSAMGLAKIPVQRSAVSTSLRAIAKAGDKGGAEIWFAGRKVVGLSGPDAARRAEDALKRLNPMFDATPELYEVLQDGPKLVYRHETLLELTPEDAAAQKAKVGDLAADALRAVRGALYVLSFRIWDER
ncbi:MAG: M48 family metalloprotease [Fimbriimonas ginsengisoli]|uniref:M48 family metalloprotease n=1 Tax=Fimbriimonas ginsengisoli TaxID=1005039 RepID=A0A931LZ26_FIMGI|nr:M48 family metalloprotease [Fimbriimonas ginsengisoli]MBI3721935.1 M48 family metalloprotease [Fimbriimonas ginsengisoli]